MLFIFINDEVYIPLLVYVDDILVTGNKYGIIAKLIYDLHAQFVLKQLGSSHYFLGIEATHDATGSYLCQSK